jgi:hypothetical protein
LRAYSHTRGKLLQNHLGPTLRLPS